MRKIAPAVKKAATQLVGKAKNYKARYDAAFEKGQQRPGAQKLKKMMKYGYRP